LSAEQTDAVARDFRSAGLSSVEVALLSFAEKVATQADEIRQEDVDALRAEGLTDEEILDVVLAAAARCFFSRVMDAVGAEPEARYLSEEPPTSR
jgi:uncharacterized peroxidase-related enzyme